MDELGIISLVLIALSVALVAAAVFFFRWRPVPVLGPPMPDGEHASYLAALLATMVIVPIVALLCSTVFYFVRVSLLFWKQRAGDSSVPPSSNTVSDKVVNSVNVLAAFLIAALVWLLAAWWWQRFTTAARANPHVYSDLTMRFDDLIARIAAVAPGANATAVEREAYAQAQTHAATIARELAMTRGDLRWVRATGYTKLWEAVHRIEEALIVLAPVEQVIAEARYDELRLKDSTITGADDLLETLRYARTGLGVAPMAGTVPPNPAVTPLQARAFLSQVRFSINEFRADRWNGLVRARNHLLATGLYTGLATNVLLALAIIAVPNRDSDGGSDVITAAVLFFVGAIIGLFNRLYLDALADDVIEDYGLGTARLMITPLFSGLAAVGGVLVTILLPGTLAGIVPSASPAPPTTAPSTLVRPTATAGTVTATVIARVTPTPPGPTGATGGTAPGLPVSPSSAPAGESPTAEVTVPVGKTARLTDVFDISRYPFELVIAAIFALTPGLLISRLQRQTEGYKADLSSTEASQQGTRRGG